LTAGGAATDPVGRAAELVALGVRGALSSEEAARLHDARTDPDPRVRAAALGALVRAVPADAHGDWIAAIEDDDVSVRRRAAELAPALHAPSVVPALIARLDDRDVSVVEAASWALGELDDAAPARGAVDALAQIAVAHRDPIAREAAVAALGALGDRAGLPAILAACDDRPAVRRRAVLALAPFDGPDVDAAIVRALEDRDWQVRQAAEDLRDAAGESAGR
jgi:HEAT repeat protein